MLRHGGRKATHRRREFSLIAQRLRERRRDESTRQDLPIKRPRNSMQTIRVGTADPAEKATIQLIDGGGAGRIGGAGQIDHGVSRARLSAARLPWLHSNHEWRENRGDGLSQ